MFIENINNAYFLKQNDTATDIHLRVLDSEENPFDLTGKEIQVVIGHEEGRYLVKEAVQLTGVGEISFGLDQGDIIPSGKQWLEVHIIEENGDKVVAPSKGFYQLRVERAIDELQAEVSTVTLDFLLTIIEERAVPGPVGPKGEQGIQGVQGPKGDKGDKGDKGEQGIQGIQGPIGLKGDKPAHSWQGSQLRFENPDGTQGTYVDLRGPQGPKGDTGPKGDKGDPGPKGDTGETGAGLNILGEFDNPSQLPASGSIGDAYLIRGDLYVWGGASWSNVGSIQGPKGDKGDTGERGLQGLKGDTGSKGDKGDKGDPGTTSWNGITDKPSTFTPSTHTHTIAQVTGLQTALDGKETPTGVQTKVDNHGSKVASSTVLGHIKVGANLTVEADGTLNAAEQGGGTAEEITITDTKNFYTSSNVEGALEEIGQTISGANGLMIADLNAIFGGRSNA